MEWNLSEFPREVKHCGATSQTGQNSPVGDYGPKNHQFLLQVKVSKTTR